MVLKKSKLHYDKPWQLSHALIIFPTDLKVKYPEEVGYYEPVESVDIVRDLDKYRLLLKNLGVKVTTIQITEQALPNILFASDNTFAWEGTVYLPGMFHSSRTPEPRVLKKMLPYDTCLMKETFPLESSDVLVTPDDVLIGVGNRTSLGAAKLVSNMIDRPYHLIKVPEGIQHLMGVVRPLAPEIVAVRTSLLDRESMDKIRSVFSKVLPISETIEVTENLGFNFVPINPWEVVLPDDVPQLEEKLQKEGVCTHRVRIKNLRKAGGGLACATGRLA